MAKAGEEGGSWGAARKRRVNREVCVCGAKVLVEITSSTQAPCSIATTEVKIPRGEGEEEEELEEEQ